MKKIMVTVILMISMGMAQQILGKEGERVEKDSFGTRPMISYFATDFTFLDEMTMRLSLTPQQTQKMMMIIKAEKEALETLQQEWQEILKDEKLSMEKKQDEKNNMDKKTVEIVEKTKIDVEQTLTPFQYKEFVPWLEQQWAQKWVPEIKPQREVSPPSNPFELAVQKNKEFSGSSATTMTEKEKEARDKFIQALQSESEKAQQEFSKGLPPQPSSPNLQKNPFGESAQGAEGFQNNEAAERFKEALRQHSEK
ncbi:MAG: hypothetical protein AB1414_06030 [bacterium]